MMQRRFWVGYVLLFFAVYLVWISVWHNDWYMKANGINILQLLAACFSTLWLFSVYRSKPEAQYRFWLYYALGSFCYLAAQGFWTIHVLISGQEPENPGIAELLWMLQYVFFMVGLSRQVKQARKRYSAIRFLLDILLLVTALLCFFWHNLADTLEAPTPESIGYTIYYIFCSTANAAVLFGLMLLFLYDRTAVSIKATFVLMVGFLSKTAGNTVYLYIMQAKAPSLFLNELPDLLWFAGLVILGLASLYPDRIGSADAYGKQRVSALWRFIPYLGITLLFMFILFALDELTSLLGTVIGVNLLVLRLFLSIYEHEATQKELYEADRKYRSLVESSQVGVFMEQDGRLIYVNQCLVDIFATSRNALLGQPLLHSIIPEERAAFSEELRLLGSEGEHSQRRYYSGHKANGDLVHLEIQMAPIVFQGQRAISGTLLDVTERKVSEELIRRSEKLSVVGQLAAGVAHEIRNPLTALKGFTQMLRSSGDGNKLYYEIMMSELDRINYIVSEFMLLSKPQQLLQLADHDIRHIMRGILLLVDTQAILNNVSIHSQWEIEVPKVVCDENQIKQVFLNLLKNAIEAMSGGGDIRISFEPHPRGHVCIRIEDNGPGIPQEHLNRLGEPFFSTKSAGTGLGLMVCYRIIEAHQGTLTISSEVNRGTTVEIMLRIHQPDELAAV
ncbi:ATP-binding protein [Paenibacillus sp. y28]|uniref:ATP-binding protein n=1 Tax=Paenibacillus sp. y28 TaxID=3129110 RepID=UPI0030160D38